MTRLPIGRAIGVFVHGGTTKNTTKRVDDISSYKIVLQKLRV
jgi:hypothetical protein